MTTGDLMLTGGVSFGFTSILNFGTSGEKPKDVDDLATAKSGTKWTVNDGASA